MTSLFGMCSFSSRVVWTFPLLVLILFSCLSVNANDKVDLSRVVLTLSDRSFGGCYYLDKLNITVELYGTDNQLWSNSSTVSNVKLEIFAPQVPPVNGQILWTKTWNGTLSGGRVKELVDPFSLSNTTWFGNYSIKATATNRYGNETKVGWQWFVIFSDAMSVWKHQGMGMMVGMVLSVTTLLLLF
ncbi:hypothetical protein C9374_009427 [Naegleria lovaniensis]|uniref:Uncharacterized protein n=1 Tax=Naegleria lovaniensis TaxID=51637 RepID=A0AA88H0Y6_NAELO|nr:uncharacterized protein C9374_009427 [Naegleria lovaniensis]KAG2392850.1 hypothetical protein C9374_009427 [Naegleria lovaniensis]